MKKFNVIKTYSTPTSEFEDEDTDIGQLNDQTWIAQTGYTYGIDGFRIIKMYFDHQPTERDLEIAFTIRAFSYDSVELYRKKGTDTWIHWLDMEGNIIEKYNKMKELIDYDCDNWDWK